MCVISVITSKYEISKILRHPCMHRDMPAKTGKSLPEILFFQQTRQPPQKLRLGYLHNKSQRKIYDSERAEHKNCC